MGEHGEQEKVGHAAGFEVLKTAPNARVSVSHGEFNVDVLIQVLQVFGHAFGIHPEWGPFLHPDFLVEGRDLPWACSKDDASNEQVAEGSRNVDDIRVKKELSQVGAHRANGGFVGCPNVHQKNTLPPHSEKSEGLLLTICSSISHTKPARVNHLFEWLNQCFIEHLIYF